MANDSSGTNRKIDIELGPTGDPLPIQFNRHQLRFDAKELDRLEKDRMALKRVFLRGLLEEDEMKPAMKRLMASVGEHIKAHN